MTDQKIINDFFRNYVDKGFKYVQNSVKLNPQHTDAHRRTTFEACNVLVQNGIPFWPEISVVDNVMGILKGLSAEGLLGLVGAFVLYHIFNRPLPKK